MEELGYHQAFYGVFLCLYGSAIIPLLFGIWKRKHLQPIQFRNIGFVFTSAFGGILMVVMICFREPDVDQFPCGLYLWISLLFLTLFFSPYILLCLRVISANELIKREKKQKSGKKLEIYESEDVKCSKKLYAITGKKYLNRGLVCVILANILLGFYLWHVLEVDNQKMIYKLEHSEESGTSYNANKNDRKGIFNIGHYLRLASGRRGLVEYEENELDYNFTDEMVDPSPQTVMTLEPIEYNVCMFNISFIPFVSLIVIYFLLFIFLLKKLSGIKDVWDLSCELKSCFLCWIFCACMFCLFIFLEPIVDNYFPPSMWILVLIVYTNVRSLLLPFIATYTVWDIDYNLPLAGGYWYSNNNKSYKTELDIGQKVQMVNTIISMGGIAIDALHSYLREKTKETALDFIIQVNAYMNMPRDEENIQNTFASDILNVYVKDRYLINEGVFESSTADICINTYNNSNVSRAVNIDLFTQLRDEAIHWIASNYISGFLESGYYATVLDNITRTRTIMGRLNDLRMLDL